MEVERGGRENQRRESENVIVKLHFVITEGKSVSITWKYI